MNQAKRQTGGRGEGGAARGAQRRLGRELVKSVLAVGACATGLLPLWVRARQHWSGQRILVLAFHRVVDDLAALPPDVLPSLCISTAGFERLLRTVAEHFEVLPLAEVERAVLGARRLGRDAAAITFDDGYCDVARRAWPILVRMGLPATAFIPSGYIGSARLLEHDRLHALLGAAQRERLRLPTLPGLLALERRHRDLIALGDAALHAASPDAPEASSVRAGVLDRLIATLPHEALVQLGDTLEERLGSPVLDEGARVMSAEELAALARGGLELGAHTISHRALVHEPPERVREELEASRQAIEAISGRPCCSFAYCNGLWNPQLVQAVRAAGYHVAVTTYDAPNRVGQHPLLLHRKTLWEGHIRGLDGRYSEARALAHLYHLYGVLALSRPVDGEVALLGPEPGPGAGPEPGPGAGPEPGPGKGREKVAA